MRSTTTDAYCRQDLWRSVLLESRNKSISHYDSIAIRAQARHSLGWPGSPSTPLRQPKPCYRLAVRGGDMIFVSKEERCHGKDRRRLSV